MASAASWNCFALMAAPAAGPQQRRRLSSLLHTSAATIFHKAPTLRSVWRQPPAEAAPFWLRPEAADYELGDEGGSKEGEGGTEAAEAPTEGAPAEVAEAAEAPAEGAPAAEEEEEAASEAGELKKKLMDLLEGTDRGLKASSDTTAEIAELIAQIEALNPTPAPTNALALLDGKWILTYTSFAQLFALLGSGRLPEVVKVDEITQSIDSESLTVQNSVEFLWPLAATSLTATAKFEVRSPRRMQIKFEKGIIVTPQLTHSIVIPEKVELLGQDIDLTPLKGLVTSIQDAAASVARTISEQAPLKISIANSDAQSWLLTTYLDEELRISRDDGGNVFVLIKEGSSLSN